VGSLGLLDVVTEEVGLEGSDRQPVFTDRHVVDL
jgi:hypothetical protein